MGSNGYMKAYHCILDNAAPHLKSAEFSLFYCIYRKTLGWNKFVDRISLSQFKEYTGLTKNTILKNLASLEEAGWIYVMREKTDGGLPFNQYALGKLVQKLNQSSFDTSAETEPVVARKLNQFKPKVVQKLNTQKIVPKDRKDSTDVFVNFINQQCVTGWHPRGSNQVEILAELEEYSFDEFKKAFHEVMENEKNRGMKPPRIFSYLLGVLRNKAAEAPPKRKSTFTQLTTEQLLAAGRPADYYTREDAGRSTPVKNMV